MGTKPFNVETANTIIASEDFTISNKMKIKTKLKTRFVFNDLAVAAISDATASSSFVTWLQSSLKVVVTPGDGLSLFYQK